MQERRAIDRLTGLVLGSIVVAILATALAHGLNRWHEVLLILGSALQVVAIAYATSSIWLPPLRGAVTRAIARARRLLARNRDLQLRLEAQPDSPAGVDPERQFVLTQEDALLAGAVAIAGAVLTLAGELLV